MRIADTRVLLTGATGGIGQALARALHARGAQLVLSARRAGVLDALAQELSAEAVTADLSSRADVTRLGEAAGAVDILVANAGLPASGHLLSLSEAEIDGLLEVNLRSQIVLSRVLAGGMAERGRGHIVLMASLSSKAASPSSSLYSATKFGLRGFALGARQDLAPAGVGVSVVLPGFVRDAGMFADSGVTLPRGVRTVTPEQVAQATIGAIERNRTEVTVAPLDMRVGSEIASVAPGLAAWFQRLAGGRKLADNLAHAQAPKRPGA